MILYHFLPPKELMKGANMFIVKYITALHQIIAISYTMIQADHCYIHHKYANTLIYFITFLRVSCRANIIVILLSRLCSACATVILWPHETAAKLNTI